MGRIFSVYISNYWFTTDWSLQLPDGSSQRKIFCFLVDIHDGLIWLINQPDINVYDLTPILSYISVCQALCCILLLQKKNCPQVVKTTQIQRVQRNHLLKTQRHYHNHMIIIMIQCLPLLVSDHKSYTEVLSNIVLIYVWMTCGLIQSMGCSQAMSCVLLLYCDVFLLGVETVQAVLKYLSYFHMNTSFFLLDFFCLVVIVIFSYARQFRLWGVSLNSMTKTYSITCKLI